MKVLIIPFLLFSIWVNAQNKPKVEEHEYYDFFDSVPNPSRDTHFILQSEPLIFDVISNDPSSDKGLFDTIFPKSDSSFLIQQANAAKGFFWGPGMIYGSRVVRRSDMRIALGQERNKAYDGWGYWAYSVPLFSSDKSIGLVKYCNFCGPICEERYVYYYKKQNDKWKAIYHYRTVKQ